MKLPQTYLLRGTFGLYCGVIYLWDFFTEVYKSQFREIISIISIFLLYSISELKLFWDMTGTSQA